MATQGGDDLEGHTLTLLVEVFQKGQLRSTRNRRACMIICMNVVGGVLYFLPTWLYISSRRYALMLYVLSDMLVSSRCFPSLSH